MGNSFPPEPKIPRLFLDSSVIIAGLASRTGASHAILALAELGLIRPVACPYILTEVERNLAKKVPEFLPAYRRLMVNLNWQMVEDPVAEDVSAWLGLVPAKDAPVLAAAAAVAPHRFITLDADHFIDPSEVAERSGLSSRPIENVQPGGMDMKIKTLFVGSLIMVLLLAACGAPSATPVPTLPASPSALEPTAPTTATPSPEDIHACQGAGTWFPGDPEELATMVDSYLSEAEKDAAKIEGEPIALIVPHAGYIYSGWVAAHAYRQVEGLDYDTVVIIGDTHTGGGAAPIAVWARGAYETPLGAVPVDEEVAAVLLAADSRILFDRAGHESEHPVENQIPFLQRTMGDFKVVPIVLHDDSLETAEVLSQALVKALADRKALIVASTDLSHWPAYDDARASDAAMLATVETMDPQALLDADREWMAKGIPDLATTMCSKGSVMTAMLAAPQLGANQVTVLQYANSGDVPIGERDRVVGYGAVMFWRGGPASLVMPTPLGPVTEAIPLTAEDKEELLAMARQAIAYFLETGAFPHFTVTQPGLLQQRGAFVTLNKHGELRGCIGHLIGDRPLYLVVQNVAVSAAVGDQRFSPVTEEELSDIEIEISVLSPLQQVESFDQIQVGRHGVIIRRGLQQAVYLPQVAPEQGWSREEMLENLSLKAGLSRDAWEKEGTRFYVFTAEVFEEQGTTDKGN